MLTCLKPLYPEFGDQSVAVIGPTFRIGRADDCHLCLDNPTVGRHHCELTFVGESLFVTDLQSLNGTYVNDYRIHNRTELVDGDVLSISTCLFLVETHPRMLSDLLDDEEEGSDSHGDVSECLT